MFKRLCDAIIERTVVPSFSGIGVLARRRLFDWQALDTYDLTGQTIVLTGGTSGIGEAAALQYAKMGAHLVLVARDKAKVDTAVATLKQTTGNDRIDSVLADLGQRDDVQRAAEDILSRWSHIDTLVHNAGALFNQRQRTAEGQDLTVELMVSAPFLMTHLLLPALCSGAKPGRVLTMSSGGMYTEPLRVDDLSMSDDDYHGAKQYARAKRAQVSLNEVWGERVDAQQCVFHALHPGWVDTPGIQGALPGFTRLLARTRLLRTPSEGADTLIWLSADERPLHSTGDFWHDRDMRDTHMTRRTRESDTAANRAALWAWCVENTGVEPSLNS